MDQKLKADKKNSSTVTQFLDPSLIGLVTFDCIKRITAKKLEHFLLLLEIKSIDVKELPRMAASQLAGATLPSKWSGICGEKVALLCLDF